MLHLTFDELVERARIGRPEEVRESMGDVQYLAFYPESGPVIFVEATVPNFVESLTQLTVRQQTMIMAQVAQTLHAHGDSIIITRDHAGKNRSARVVRIRGLGERENEVHVLITR